MSDHYVYEVKATVDEGEACNELFDSLHGYREVTGSHQNGTVVGASLRDRSAAKDLAWRWLMHNHVTSVSVAVGHEWRSAPWS